MYLKTALLTAVCLISAANPPAAESRTQSLLNFDWTFLPGDPADAQKPEFNDAEWQAVNLPHDWSIYGPFNEKTVEGQANGFRPRAVGWYRKTFDSPAAGQRVFLDFEGIYTDADVWLNGTHVGRNHNGYLGFRFDVTDQLNPFGKPNVLAVRADNTRLGSSRWYTGGGINRDVHLITTAPVHIPQYGTWISTPAVEQKQATVHVETIVTNSSSAEQAIMLTTEICDPAGKSVVFARDTRKAPAGAAVTFKQDLAVAQPQRWSTESPNLYRAVSRVEADQKSCDMAETAFGIRTIEFSPDRGLLLNGRKVNVKGFNIHHELGCLGAAAFERGYERRFELMKEMGCNAVRLAHNPYPPVVLDLCDRMGILVFDEAYDKWRDQYTGPERPFETAWREDLTTLVRRDRNHPSVFIWSVGNEVLPHQVTAPDYGVDQYRVMAALVKSLDPFRAVTCGLYPARAGGIRLNAKPNSLYREADAPPIALAADVASYNYMQDFFERDRQRHPKMVFLASEIGTNGSGEQWFDYDHSYTVGQFYWGGFDYIGESFGWPVKGWFRGLIDLAGFRKPASYYVESVFSDGPMVHVAVQDPRPGDNVVWNDARLNWEYLSSHWNWPEGETMEVFTYSTGDTVELFLNGRSLGTKKMADCPKMKMRWKVPFEPGTLKAVATRDGKVIAEHQLQTAGKSLRLVLESDRSALKADGLDLAHVTVRVVDANGITVPDAAQKIRFSVTGAGTNAGVDNGNMYSDELWQANERTAYNGKALLVVRAGRQAGTVHVQAFADGLEPAEVDINVK